MKRRTKPNASRRRTIAGSEDRSPLLPLKEVPTYEALEDARRRFPDLEIDPESLAAHLSLLHVVSNVVAAVAPHFARRGLSKARFAVLVIILFYGSGRLSPSEIADRANVTRATVTGLLDGLERQGLARREKSQGDRRRLEVCLTVRGERLLRAFLPEHFRRIATLMGFLGRAEKRTLVDLLAKVRAGVAALGESP